MLQLEHFQLKQEVSLSKDDRAVGENAKGEPQPCVINAYTVFLHPAAWQLNASLSLQAIFAFRSRTTGAMEVLVSFEG